MNQIRQEWLKSSSIDKDHHLPYLETRPPLIQPKRELSSVADKSHHPLIMILLASFPFILCGFFIPSPSNPCSLKPLNFLLLGKEICTLLLYGSSSKNGEGNFRRLQEEGRASSQFFELKTQMIG